MTSITKRTSTVTSWSVSVVIVSCITQTMTAAPTLECELLDCDSCWASAPLLCLSGN